MEEYSNRKSSIDPKMNERVDDSAESVPCVAL